MILTPIITKGAALKKALKASALPSFTTMPALIAQGMNIAIIMAKITVKTNHKNPEPTHQPERPVSCTRRQVSARNGNKVNQAKLSDIGYKVIPITGASKIDLSSIFNKMPVETINSTQYQNSDREARPLNLKYCLNPLSIAATKPTSPHSPYYKDEVSNSGFIRRETLRLKLS